MITLLLLWSCLLLVGMKKSKGGMPFNKKSTMSLRGICAIEIMMGHLGIATESLVLFPNRKAGILFVGIFFALSGYGLMHSIAWKDRYLEGFLRKKFVKLFAPAYIVFLISIVIQSLINQDIACIVKVIDLKEFFYSTNWYVWEQGIMYILFFICAQIDRSFKRSSFLLLGFSICFVICAFMLNFDNPWYGSTMCFWLGIMLYLKEAVLINYLCKKHWIKKTVIGILILFASIAAFFCCPGIIGDLVARNVASLIFVLLVFMFLQKFTIGNSVTMWLGKYSYEIFLFHLLIIRYLRPYISNNVFYSYAVVVLTVVVSFGYRKCADRIACLGSFLREHLSVCNMSERK